MKVHQLIQGAPEWDAFRLEHFGASEAATMLGVSLTTTRTALLRAKHTGIAKEFSDWLRVNVLDHGHVVEAAARPHIEAIVGEELFPVTLSDGSISASCDGLTLTGDVAMEHKQWSESLAQRMQAGEMPEEHMPQCQQVLMVSKAERLLFVVSDGTPERMLWCWVHPDPAWFKRLRDGWRQFAADLAAYTLPPAAEPARAEPMESLPAVAVRLDGALTVAGNLPTFAAALKAFIAKMPQKPATDDEFATTDAACKALKRAEEALDAAEAGALASITDVEAMRRAVADCRKLARDTRLAAEKMVERRKAEVKEHAVMAARRALDDHIAGLNAELAPMQLQPVAADFGGSIKGLRSIASMQDALDTTLANAKIAADAQARVIRGNIVAFKAAAVGLEFLFADLGTLVHKAADDFAAAMSARIVKHRADEAEKARKAAEAEAQRIAAAEQRAREQEAARIAEQQRQQAEAERQAAAVLAAAATPASHPAPPLAQDECRPLSVVLASKPDAPMHAREAAAAIAAPRADEPATLKLGTICERLGFTVSAAFVADVLHVAPARTEGRAVLYRESQWPVICGQLASHVRKVADLYAAMPA